MVQDIYPWSPIVSRCPFKWPDNAGVALAVVVNLEHWDWETPPGTPLPESPMGGSEGLWTGNQSAFPNSDAQTQADHTRSIRLLGKSMTLSRGSLITSRLSIRSNGG
jgi:hypothetical protein